MYGLFYPPRTFLTDNGFVCELCGFIEIVQKHFGFKIKNVQFASNESKYIERARLAEKEFPKLIKPLEFFLAIAYSFNLNNLFKHITTYMENKKVLMVTYPPKIPIYEEILFLPFDGLNWMFLIITIGVSAVIWRLYKNPDSSWHFIFVLYGYFLGRSVKLRV